MAGALVFDARRRVLQEECASVNTHCEALQQVARCLRGRLSAKSCRRLRALDVAVGLLNHVMPLSIESFIDELRHGLGRPSLLHVRPARRKTRLEEASGPLIVRDPWAHSASALQRPRALTRDPRRRPLATAMMGGALQQAGGGKLSGCRWTARCGHLSVRCRGAARSAQTAAERHRERLPL